MSRREEKLDFEDEMRALEGDIAMAGQVGVYEGMVRAKYQEAVRWMAEEIRTEAVEHRITWFEAAERAHEARDRIRAIMRAKSTPFGRAVAEALKSVGPTFNELIAKYAIKLFGANTRFDTLATVQRNQIYAEIVASAARADPKASINALRWARAGQGLLIIGVAIACYNIYNAGDRVDAAKREGAVAGAGIAGGAAAGALAGLMCGPGAPVCVGIGAFVGGALAAAGADSFWRK